MEIVSFLCILCGTGIGVAYNAIVTVTNAWFPDRKGFCSGILMMSFGASTLLLGNLAGALIGAETVGWRRTYMILGIAIGAVLLITGMLSRFPTEEVQLNWAKGIKEADGTNHEDERDWTAKKMVASGTFWRLFLYLILSAAVGLTVISFARDLAINIGAGASLATSLVGVLSVCNGLGRIFSGTLFDSLGCRKTMLAATAVTILAPVVLILALLFGSVTVGIFGLCLTGVSYGCCPTITLAFVSSSYGSRYFAMNFSIANTMLVPASFVATLASSLVSSTNSFIVPIAMLLAFAAVSLGLNLSIRQPR
jgi:OFA family oxalate/formate antiporter-like MFS transporter